MDAQTLSRAMGGALSLARYEELLPHFEESMRLAEITTVRRAAMWCAQIGHESGGLRWLRELWGPTSLQLTYDNHPSLGNRPGEGKKFMGRGVIQVTGRANYTAFSKWAHGKGLVSSPTYFVDNPTALEEPRWAFVSAVWYWTAARPQLNQAADNGDVAWATRLIQGGSGNLADRQARYDRAIQIGSALLPSTKSKETPMADYVISYPRDQITQETNYFCGPASTQTVIRGKAKKLVSESSLAGELRTHVGGTDYIGQFPPVLNKHLPGADYRIVNIPGSMATAAQIEQLWTDLNRSIRNDYGVVANIISPPSNRPRIVPPSTIPFSYSSGTIYHYIAVMGVGGSGSSRRVWIADSGFYPYQGWISLENLAHLIAGKGYAASFAPAKTVTKPATPKEESMSDSLRWILDQQVGAQRNKKGEPTYEGWNVETIFKAAFRKQFKNMTQAEMQAVILYRIGDLANAISDLSKRLEAIESKESK